MRTKSLWIVTAYCILGAVMILLPFPGKLFNVLLFLAVGFAAGLILPKTGYQGDAKKDQTIEELEGELARLKLELHDIKPYLGCIGAASDKPDENNGLPSRSMLRRKKWPI